MTWSSKLENMFGGWKTAWKKLEKLEKIEIIGKIGKIGKI